MQNNSLLDSYQSVYQKDLLTETGLLKVNSDISETCDKQTMARLVLLNVSASFEVIYQAILLNHLQHPLVSGKRLYLG